MRIVVRAEKLIFPVYHTFTTIGTTLLIPELSLLFNSGHDIPNNNEKMFWCKF